MDIIKLNDGSMAPNSVSWLAADPEPTITVRLASPETRRSVGTATPASIRCQRRPASCDRAGLLA
jgi:hypothetical protein